MWESDVGQILIAFLETSTIFRGYRSGEDLGDGFAVNREGVKENYNIATTTLICIAHRKKSTGHEKARAPGTGGRGFEEMLRLTWREQYPSREGSSIQ